jgi:hypothetical protein
MRSVLGAAVCSAMIAVAALSAPASAQHPTKKACEEQWRAAKAANQTTETQKAYVEKCRAGPEATQTAPAAPPPSRPAATTTAPPAQQTPPVQPAARPQRTTTATAPANLSADEAQARARCPADTVVWVNTSSKIYHFAGHSDYGKTKQGKFMCEREATADGFRAAKNEKHP